jgi:hypothetical protein
VSKISAFLAAFSEILHDPVLRRWRWRQLRQRGAALPDASLARPGDLAVSGAALYRLALQAGDEIAAAQGLRQLLSAAETGIAPSGITIEGSSLRQLQLAGLFLQSWLAARNRGRPEQWRLAAIARTLLAALRAITLPGGLPDIGGAPTAPVAADPLADLTGEDRCAVLDLQRQARLDDLEALRLDGWLRRDDGPWSGLWHCPPGGWPLQGSLTHQDAGSAEIHWQGIPLFVDPGTPAADHPQLVRLFGSAMAHSGISLDSHDPYPFNRALYDDGFRREIAGPKPSLRCIADGVRLDLEGYGRFGGHRRIERQWRFAPDRLTIEDLVLGTGQPLIERRLVTPWQVSRSGAGLTLSCQHHHLVLVGDQPITLHPAIRWRDGVREDMTLILFAGRANLPWRGALTLTAQ